MLSMGAILLPSGSGEPPAAVGPLPLYFATSSRVGTQSCATSCFFRMIRGTVGILPYYNPTPLPMQQLVAQNPPGAGGFWQGDSRPAPTPAKEAFPWGLQPGYRTVCRDGFTFPLPPSPSRWPFLPPSCCPSPFPPLPPLPCAGASAWPWPCGLPPGRRTAPTAPPGSWPSWRCPR